MGEREELQDSLDGVKAELASALSVIWQHAGAEGRTWLFLNFPGWTRKAALTGSCDPNPYLPKDWQRPKPDLSKQFKMPREGIDY